MCTLAHSYLLSTPFQPVRLIPIVTDLSWTHMLTDHHTWTETTHYLFVSYLILLHLIILSSPYTHVLIGVKLSLLSPTLSLNVRKHVWQFCSPPLSEFTVIWVQVVFSCRPYHSPAILVTYTEPESLWSCILSVCSFKLIYWPIISHMDLSCQKWILTF